MVVQIIRVGNSRGLRIPKSLLEQYHIDTEVDLQPTKDGLLLKPLRSNARAGWGDKFSAMAKNGDDRLLMPEAIDAEDHDWQWTAPRKSAAGRRGRRQ